MNKTYTYTYCVISISGVTEAGKAETLGCLPLPTLTFSHIHNCNFEGEAMGLTENLHFPGTLVEKGDRWLCPGQCGIGFVCCLVLPGNLLNRMSKHLWGTLYFFLLPLSCYLKCGHKGWEPFHNYESPLRMGAMELRMVKADKSKEPGLSVMSQG